MFSRRWRGRHATAKHEEGRAKMVWHIFKKDWKLAWGFVMAVASLHWIAAFVEFWLGGAGENQARTMLSQVLPGLSIFCSMFSTSAIVQLDALSRLEAN